MRAYLLLGMLGLSLIPPANAAEWSMDGRLNQNLSYEDNVQMENDNKQGSFVYNLQPSLNASYRAQHSEVIASASYGVQIFEAIPERDRNNQSYSLAGSYFTDRTTYSLSTSYSIAPARDSAETDSGDFATNANRSNWSVAPVISYRISPQDSLSVQGSYGESIYSNGDLSGNNNAGLNLSWDRQWTERYSSGVGVAYSRYESEPSLQGVSNSILSNTYSLNLNNKYSFSEKWQLQANLGYRYTGTANRLSVGPVINQGSNGFVGNVNLQYTGEAFTASLGANQGLQPSGQGQLNLRAGADLSFGYRFTERLSTALTFNYSNNKPIAGLSQLVGDQRQNINISPSVNYRLAADWMLGASYRLRLQDESLGNGMTDSNTIMLTLGYNWQGFSLSR